MVNLRLKKSDNSNRRLLPSQRQGLFGKKKKTYARSEEGGIEKLGRYQAPPKIDFDTPESSSSSNKESENSPVNQVVTTEKELNEDNETQFSDLTADRTYKRAVEQYHLEQQQRHQQQLEQVPEDGDPNFDGGMLDPPGEVVRSHSGAANTLVADDNEVVTSGENEGSFMAKILGVVDQACTPKADENESGNSPAIPKVFSYTPEWGMAPNDDGTVDRPSSPFQWKSPETYSIAITRDHQSMLTGPIREENDEAEDGGRESPPSASAKASVPRRNRPVSPPPPRAVTPTFDVSDRPESPSGNAAPQEQEHFELVLDETALKNRAAKSKAKKKSSWMRFRNKEENTPVSTATAKTGLSSAQKTSKVSPQSSTTTKVSEPVQNRGPSTSPAKRAVNVAPQSAPNPSPSKPKKKPEPKIQVKSRKAILAAAKVTAKKNAEMKKKMKSKAAPIPSIVETTASSTPVHDAKATQSTKQRNLPSRNLPSQSQQRKDSKQSPVPASTKEGTPKVAAKQPVIEPAEYKGSLDNNDKKKRGFLHKVRTLGKEKKESSSRQQPGVDSHGNAQQGQDSPKEARLKQVLVAFHGASKGPLSSIVEENDDTPDSSGNDAAELKVRVPGGSAILSDGDLIGEEVVDEEDDEDLEEDSESESYDSEDDEDEASEDEAQEDEEVRRLTTSLLAPTKPVGRDHEDKPPTDNTVKAADVKSLLPAQPSPQLTNPDLLDFDEPGPIQKVMPNSPARSRDTAAEVTAIEAIPDPDLGKAKSWKERLGLRKVRSNSSSENKVMVETSTPNMVRRQWSAPEEVTGSTGKASKRKSPWKTAVDPATGREYYYHRLTRKTTWSKPPELKIIAEPDEESEIERPVDRAIRREASSSTTKSPIRKSSKRDFDPAVWEKKEQIANLLETMAPPDGESVERLMSKYEGREDELLIQLKELKETKPFDEPTGSKNKSSISVEGNSSVAMSSLGGPTMMQSRTQTATSYRSGASGLTRLSEATPQIQNTSKGRGGIAPIIEDDAASISSKENQNLQSNRPVVPFSRKTQRQRGRVPSRVPVPRARELQVEEFSDGFRRNNIRGVVRSARKQPPTAPRRAKPVPPPDGHEPEPARNMEDDKTHDASTVSLPNDDISALSMTDNEFMGRGGGNPEQEAARRRAFDDAVAREDWDLAAALSEGMRALKKKPRTTVPPPSRREWTQTELDRFISENDWDAVANYIAKVRASNKSKTTKKTNKSGQRPGRGTRDLDSQSEDDSQIRKRFGARSQLQHTELNSYSSWDSSSYDESDDYSSGSYSSEDRRYSQTNRRRVRGKEFAC